MWVPLLIMFGIGAAGLAWWSIFVGAAVWLIVSFAYGASKALDGQVLSAEKLAVAALMYLIICAAGYWLGRGAERLVKNIKRRKN